jgi:hypothetical protein
MLLSVLHDDMIVYAHLEKSGNIRSWPIKFVKKFLGKQRKFSVKDESSPYLHNASKTCNFFLMEMKWDS